MLHWTNELIFFLYFHLDISFALLFRLFPFSKYTLSIRHSFFCFLVSLWYGGIFLVHFSGNYLFTSTIVYLLPIFLLYILVLPTTIGTSNPFSNFWQKVSPSQWFSKCSYCWAFSPTKDRKYVEMKQKHTIRLCPLLMMYILLIEWIPRGIKCALLSIFPLSISYSKSVHGKTLKSREEKWCFEAF